MIYLIFVLSLVAVTKGADWLVDGAVGLTKVLGISQIVVGATVVSLGTTLPEMLVSGMAAYQGKGDVVAGTAIGSIMFNTAVILGLAALIKPLRLTSRHTVSKAGTMIGVLILFALLALDQYISRTDALLLALLLLGFIVSNIQQGMGDSKGKNELPAKNHLYAHLARLLVGSVLVVLGAKFLLDSGTELARIFGVSEAVIAVTLFAIGSSLPELITAITAARKGHTDLVLGNVMGANTLNIVFVISMAGLLHPFAVDSSVYQLDVPISLIMMTILFLPAFFTKRIGRTQGLITIFGYVSYLVFLLT